MVVDAVIRHWVMLVAGEEAGPDNFRQEFQWLAALFDADDGFITSPRLAWIQAILCVLTGLFGSMGLQKNIKKMVWMVFSSATLSEETWR